MELVDCNADLRDFNDTAALLSNLDLVIAVDTAVAHLAGALGRPVWVMLPFCPDFRWLTKREDSPWYPHTRLFRQSQPKDWDPVVARVAEALRALV
jgi:ADP-heptose:LPS heptosyltransferase